MPSVTFVAEQDGEIEQQLKARVVPILKGELESLAAYLVRVSYDHDSEQRVALALHCPTKREIVDAVGAEFRNLFNSQESMDITFLSEEQLRNVRLGAKPFFEQNLHSA